MVQSVIIIASKAERLTHVPVPRVMGGLQSNPGLAKSYKTLQNDSPSLQHVSKKQCW